MGGPYIGFGIQRIIDAQLIFVRNTLPVFLRVRNFTPVNVTLAGQLGFAATPSGTAVGTTDILIAPPPAIKMVSMHNIGMSGGKLMIGARQFMLTQTFVSKMLVQLDQPDGWTMWKCDKVVGLFTDGKLFSIEDIAHEEMGGTTIVWTLTCNSLSTK